MLTIAKNDTVWMNKNGKKKKSCRCLILEKKTIRWVFRPLNPKARIKERHINEKTPPKFNMVHLEMDGFPSSVHLQNSKGFSPIFRWSNRLGLGGVKKNWVGQKGQGSGELHADEDQTKVTSTVNSIYKNHPIFVGLHLFFERGETNFPS